MTKQEILTKAITKAVAGGFRQTQLDLYTNMKEIWYIDELKRTPSFIFSHDFLKAFFGEEEVELVTMLPKHMLDGYDMSITLEAWQAHAMTMVISEDPIMYLSKFI